MCSLSPGSGVGLATGASEAPAAGWAASTGVLGRWAGAGLEAAGALPVLAASVAAEPRRGGPAAPSSLFSVLAFASVLASVAVTSMVNNVLAGLRITPRFGLCSLSPGRANQRPRPFTGQTRRWQGRS